VEVLEGVPAAVYAPDDLLVQKLRWFQPPGQQSA
jgi:hypothetical protein